MSHFPTFYLFFITGFEEPVSYHLLQTSSFHNHSWVHLSSGWLGELQIHRWNSSSDAIIYLYPWSRGNFSNRELVDLERFLRVNSIGIQEFYTDYFMSEVHDSSSPDPFDLQIATGCELHSGKGFLGLKHVAIQGYEFMSFQNETWSPSPEGGRKAQKVCRLLSQNQDYTQRLQRLLSDTCPRFTLGLLDAGKAQLQQQVKPEAWLSSGPSPGPGRLLLVCHVSGFYPKPMWVMWMRGEEEQQGTQRGDILPNADGTWYLRAILDVAAGEVAGLACRVKHSSLGRQDLVLHWGAPPSALGWILLAVIVALALLTGLGFWFRKRWTHCEAPCSAVPLK
nr:T-cell surface glycoprotein CD1b-3-like isoform X2 [Marmota flaviventris]XP_027776027.1 T-cell surface glycoprotein CD1b-3-like isoform X2 [Marmota flaviventris]XP_027776028.1 T-cell surface glycoprotein CD1b-3-like isoform X2 [Marmota flaviventris]XP_027776029.1 T-cell surface glycoprotein CD1b-3-like isoform X2 [Marmota flaviventris]XP_027776030.1 T-cell surface glycoprotein CD1b-3-like isoform X2 [Marmota flaviventris]XP_027776031.1 T-cell surface glycoprotein CD1b-3-like isoform X2 [Mar